MQELKKKFTIDEQLRLSRRLEAKKINAEKRGLECTLNMEDMFMLGFKLLGHGNCDYTNLSFSTIVASGAIADHPKYPTLERIDDKLGYVRGNVCVVMRRANELKDNLIDKTIATNIVEPLDRSIVRAMMLNMSNSHMEQLKTKYLPPVEEQTEENKTVETEIKQEASIDNTQAENEYGLSPAQAPIGDTFQQDPNTVEAYVERVSLEEKVEEQPKSVPDDVSVAKAYAKYCTDFADAGMNVSVSFAQFKSKYIRKICALTGEDLLEDPKFILVLDLNVGFAKDNFIVVGSKIGNAITTMMISTGYSVPRIWGMLNKVVG